MSKFDTGGSWACCAFETPSCPSISGRSAPLSFDMEAFSRPIHEGDGVLASPCGSRWRRSIFHAFVSFQIRSRPVCQGEGSGFGPFVRLGDSGELVWVCRGWMGSWNHEWRHQKNKKTPVARFRNVLFAFCFLPFRSLFPSRLRAPPAVV